MTVNLSGTYSWPYEPPPIVWMFHAASYHGPEQRPRPSIRLGTVVAYSEEDAKAKIQKYFRSGYFHPIEINVYPIEHSLHLNIEGRVVQATVTRIA